MNMSEESYNKLLRDKEQLEKEVFNLKKISLYQFKVLDTIHEPTSVVDENYKYVFVNKAYTKYFNKSSDEIIGHNVVEFFGDENFNIQIKPHFDKCLKGEHVVCQNRVDFEDVGERYFLINYYPFYNEQNEISGVISTSKDITEVSILRKDHEDILNALDDVLIVINKDFEIEEINENGIALIGKNKNEIIGQKCYKIIHDKDEPEDYCPLCKSLRSKKTETTEHYEKIFNRCYSLKSSPVFNARGEIVKYVDLMRDVTIRKKKEDELKLNEEKLRLIGDNIPKGMIYQLLVCPNGNIQFTYVSKKVEELYETTAENIIRDPSSIFKKILPEDLPKFLESREKSIRDLSEFNHTVRMKRKSGEIRWHSLISRPRKLNNGNILFDGIVSDITEQKIYELQLRKYSKELKKHNRDKDKFMSILAHDLKNPINTIQGFLQILKKNIHKYNVDKIEDKLDIMKNTADKAYNLIEDILLWSKSQSGKIIFEPEEFNLCQVCKSVIEESENRAESKGISIKCNMSDSLNVFADINLVKTIMRNLLSNAIKFTYKDGKVVFDVEENENEVIVSISDTGMGIEKNVLSNIFNIAINSTMPGTNNEEGTGLGLQICKEFVEKMGGRIWVESELGKGSVFYFSINK